MREELEVLFAEAAALGNRLKKNARNLHRNDNLSATGRLVLQTLHLHGPQTVPQLAALRSTSRQNIQVLADRLEAAGYITFQANPAHKRSDLVSLTDAGKALLASANQREAELIAQFLTQTTKAEIVASAELLRKLRSLLGGDRKRRARKAATAPSPASAKPMLPETPEEEFSVSLL
jgi:DNA-binding MarR family transcriptional regulator